MKYLVGFFVGALIGAIVYSKLRPSRVSMVEAPSEPKLLPSARVEASDSNFPLWPEFSLENVDSFVAHLRESGCPESQIRSLVIAEVNRFFFKRTQAGEHAQSRGVASQNIDYAAARKSRLDVLTAVFGENISIEDFEVGAFYKDSAPLAGINRVSQLVYDSMRLRMRDEVSAIRDAAKGFLTAADERAIENIEQSYYKELGRLLPPADFRKIQVHEFATRSDVQHLIENIEVSASQVEAIYDYSSVVEKLPLSERAAADLELLPKLKEKLGEVKYSQFMNSQDADYREALAVTRRYGLPESKADEIIFLRNESMGNRLSAGDPAIDQDLAQPILDDYLRSTRDEVLRILGPEAGKVYLEEGSGSTWAR